MGGGTSPVVRQAGFRGRGDTVGINSTTWDYAQNTNFSWNVNTNLRMRILISDSVTSTKTSNYTNVRLQYNLAGGGLNFITGTTPIQYVTSSQFTDGDSITSAQITGGAGSFVNGYGDTNNSLPVLTLGNGNDHTVIEFCIRIDSEQVSNGQTFTLEVDQMDTTALQIPTITIIESAPSFKAAWAHGSNRVLGVKR